MTTLRARCAARLRPRAEGGAEDGIGLADVLAATLILMVIVVSFSNLLVDSLSATLLSKQREQAASLASDVVENAKALGQTQLSAAPTGSSTCTAVSAGSPVPVLTVATFQQCFTVAVDNTRYSVTPSVTASTTGPDTVVVTVTWASAQHTYLTTTLVGTGQAGT